MKPSICFFALSLPALLSGAEAVKLDTGTGVLYGTIALPSSKPPYPAVLIIAGSGPTDRDGNNPLLPGHNDSLKMIADGLAARGIASLRYDKRAIGESRSAGVKEEDLRFETYVDDAVRWGQYLRKDSRFRGLVVAGHSEGSLIGMIAAGRLGANGFISIAGAGMPGGQIILKQLREQGTPPDFMKSVESVVKALEEGRKPEAVPTALVPMFHATVQPYLISWFKYDPAREIAKLKMPVLILQGTTDIQISVDDAKLLAAGDPAAKLVLMEGMNHVLKEAPADRKKNIAAYSDPSLPVVPKLLDEMVGLVDGLKLKN